METHWDPWWMARQRKCTCLRRHTNWGRQPIQGAVQSWLSKHRPPWWPGLKRQRRLHPRLQKQNEEYHGCHKSLRKRSWYQSYHPRYQLQPRYTRKQAGPLLRSSHTSLRTDAVEGSVLHWGVQSDGAQLSSLQLKHSRSTARDQSKYMNNHRHMGASILYPTPEKWKSEFLVFVAHLTFFWPILWLPGDRKSNSKPIS